MFIDLVMTQKVCKALHFLPYRVSMFIDLVMTQKVCKVETENHLYAFEDHPRFRFSIYFKIYRIISKMRAKEIFNLYQFIENIPSDKKKKTKVRNYNEYSPQN